MRESNRTIVGRRRSLLAVITLLALGHVACRPDSGQPADFEALEQQWATAQQFRDSAALESLLAPEFHLVERADGVPIPRDQYITGVLHTAAEDTIRIEKIGLVHWGDSATVSSRFHCTVVHEGRVTATYEFQTTDRWVSQSGRWLAVSRTMLVHSD
jgi:hypothetical protein